MFESSLRLGPVRRRLLEESLKHPIAVGVLDGEAVVDEAELDLEVEVEVDLVAEAEELVDEGAEELEPDIEYTERA